MEPKKDPHAVALARLGASKGGIARAAKLSAQERRVIAQRAAQARWEKKSDQSEQGGLSGSDQQ